MHEQCLGNINMSREEVFKNMYTYIYIYIYKAERERERPLGRQFKNTYNIQLYYIGYECVCVAHFT